MNALYFVSLWPNIPIMKRLSFLLLFFALVSNAFAQGSWTVSTVPNTRLQDNGIHVSDPDDYLSDTAEMTINTALCSIRDTADVFVVLLGSIGSEEPKRFATSLFNRWGIGDAGRDNGVLLLVVEDQRALEFETGYGAEVVLTDARCARIFNKTIAPYFRNGDYEGGFCAGVAEIVEIYGGEVPERLMTFLPVMSNDSGSSNESDFEDMGALTIFVFLLIMGMPVVAVVYWMKKRNDKTMTPEIIRTHEEGGITYLEGTKTSWSGSPWEGRGCLSAMMLGFSLFVFYLFSFTAVSKKFPQLSEKWQFNIASVIALVLYLTWICFRQGRRILKVADDLASKSVNPSGVYQAAANHTANKVAFYLAPWLGWWYRKQLNTRIAENDDCQCPTCHVRMKKDSSFRLSDLHAIEQRIGAMYYQPYCCPNGHAFVVREKGKKHSDYSTCDACGGYTLKKTQTKTLTEATYSHSGEKEETYECQNCGHAFTKKVSVPKLVYYSSDSGYSSGSSSRSYHSSSRSSGGSFGGGRSGGGGFSGRW